MVAVVVFFYSAGRHRVVVFDVFVTNVGIELKILVETRAYD